MTSSCASCWRSITGGNPAHYGFAFGCYDLTQFLFIPMFGKISDTCGMKSALIMTLTLNILGNLMYSMAFWFSHPTTDGTEGSELGHWELILVGRLVAGCGSAALSLGVTFFTITTSISDRDEAITTYRIWQTIARAIATQAPMALTALPNAINSDFDRVFNFYTCPGWITTALSSIALLLVLIFFRTPDSDQAVFKNLETDDFRSSFFGQKSDMSALWYHVIMFSVSGFCTTFVVFSIYSQLFAFAFAKYKMIDNMQDMYIVFVGMAIGASVGIILFKILHSAKGKAAGFKDYMFILSGNIFFIIALGSLMLVSDVFFFVGSGFMGAGLIFFFPMCESFYTKKITQYQSAIPDQIGLYTAFMPASGSLGRFLGPTVGALMFTVTENTYSELKTSLCGTMDLTKSYEDENYLGDRVENCAAYCANPHNGSESSSSWALSSDADLPLPCEDLDSMCNFDFPTHFFNKGCELDDAQPMLVLVAVLAVNLLGFCCYFKNHRHVPGESDSGLSAPINFRGAE